MKDLSQVEFTIARKAELASISDDIRNQTVDTLVQSGLLNRRWRDQIGVYAPSWQRYHKLADLQLRVAWYKELKEGRLEKSVVEKRFIGEAKMENSGEVIVPMTEFTLKVPLFLEKQKDIENHVKFRFRETVLGDRLFVPLGSIEIVEI